MKLWDVRENHVYNFLGFPYRLLGLVELGLVSGPINRFTLFNA